MLHDTVLVGLEPQATQHCSSGTSITSYKHTGGTSATSYTTRVGLAVNDIAIANVLIAPVNVRGGETFVTSPS